MSTQRSIIERDLIALLAGVINVDPASVKPEAGLADVGINSIDLVEAIFVIEEKYGISISYNANAANFASVGVLLEMVIDQIEQQQQMASPIAPQMAAQGA
jgi:acyl carrier protein